MFIKLTLVGGKPVAINIHQIIWFWPIAPTSPQSDPRCHIKTCDSESFKVMESFEVVAQAITTIVKGR